MEFAKIIYVITIPILNVIGFITNIISIIVFSLIIKNEQRDGDMYKHLLLKSICEMLGCFFSIFNAIYRLNGMLSRTFIMTIWLIWFHEYINKALFMASTGFEIAATFSCAISIEKRMKWCEKRLSFWLWVLFILILSFGVEIYSIFLFTIRKVNDIDQFNRTIHYYELRLTRLFRKIKILGLIDSIIREVIFLIILLSLNSYILYKIIQIGRRKKRLTSNSSNVQNSNRAENRKIIMIIVLFLTFLLGHLPNFLIFAVNNGHLTTLFWFYFTAYGDLFLYLSYFIFCLFLF
jgi:hypothetical protein